MASYARYAGIVPRDTNDDGVNALAKLYKANHEIWQKGPYGPLPAVVHRAGEHGGQQRSSRDRGTEASRSQSAAADLHRSRRRELRPIGRADASQQWPGSEVLQWLLPAGAHATLEHDDDHHGHRWHHHHDRAPRWHDDYHGGSQHDHHGTQVNHGRRRRFGPPPRWFRPRPLPRFPTSRPAASMATTIQPTSSGRIATGVPSRGSGQKHVASERYVETYSTRMTEGLAALPLVPPENTLSDLRLSGCQLWSRCSFTMYIQKNACNKTACILGISVEKLHPSIKSCMPQHNYYCSLIKEKEAV